MTGREKIAFSLAILLLVVVAYMQVYAGFTGDKDWLLFSARMWVDGRRLYVDIFQPNLPLIIWFYAIPVWISMHVPGLADYEALSLIGLGLSAVCVWLSVRLIRLHPAFAENTRRQVEFALLLAYVFVFFPPPYCFFDREHFMLVLIFPYMLRLMPGLATAKPPLHIRVGIGLLAAAGFCIKPHTVIIFAVLQLLVMLRERSFSILSGLENGIIYAVTLVYCICIWYFTPEYIAVVVPMAMATYSAFSHRENGLIYMAFAFFSAGLTFADFRARFATPYRKDVYYFIGVCCAFAAYALANNGWVYTYNPLLCILLFTNGWVLWEFGWLKREHDVQNLNSRPFVFGARDCIINFLLNVGLIVFLYAKAFTVGPCDPVLGCKGSQPFVQYLLSHNVRSFGFMSLDFERWVKVSRLSGAGWDTRFNHLWMLPKLVGENKESAAKNRWIVDYVGRAYAEDLTLRKPEIIFVDSGKPAFFGRVVDLNIPQFFSTVPEFKEAWSHYHYAATIDECHGDQNDDSSASHQATGCMFDIYSRSP